MEAEQSQRDGKTKDPGRERSNFMIQFHKMQCSSPYKTQVPACVVPIKLQHPLTDKTEEGETTKEDKFYHSTSAAIR